MKQRAFGVVLGLAMVAGAAGLMSDPASAYEEVTVSDGGTLTGVVKLEGVVPKPKGYNLTTLPDPYYCGRISDGEGWRILQPFNVGPKGEFREVVVYLEG
ncbi:MAG: carboxypeptidase regulatory-like domain-containing protein, partial [Nitrospira sp.]|nr:carboxypeptidase regulatory-like domain-containing protein [Nitrospira sp.]